ncbi:MAG: xanthine dehydrogenase family protein molybdopterin-binding subunit [Kiloniellales bacterium]
MTDSIIGARIGRFEDRALLTGQAQYLDDIHMVGMVEMAFVRSPHPHALIRGIDSSKALTLPGVYAVYSHADLASVLTTDRIPQDKAGARFPDTTWPVVLPRDETCFVGEPVAAVVAESRYIAEDAAALVEVDYEPLEPAADCRDAAAPGAPKVHREAQNNIVTEFRTDYGDCAAAFAAADHVFAISLKQHRGAGHPIEGRGTIARYSAVGDEMTVWASVQTPHKLRNGLMELFGVDESGVRVIVPDVGGAFGAKNLVYPEDVMVAVAARLLERPVKWAEDRREHFLAAVQERDQYWDLEIACDGEGRIQGVRGKIIHDQGAYTLLGLHTPHNCSIGVPGPYVVPNYQIDVVVVETNKVGCVPIRGAGYPEASFAMERLLDEIARGLGLDRAELRRRNLIPAEKMPYEHPMKTREGTPTIYDTGDFPACQVQALETADYAGFAARQARARSEGRYLGIGVSNMVKVTGRGPFESGVVRVGRSGRVSVYTGAMEMGQGTKTSLAQICAEHLGVPPGEITVVAGDTGAVLHGIGGYGSRQTVTGGSAVHLAAIEVRDKALKVAAHTLEVSERDLELKDGEARVKGAPELSMSLADIAKALAGAKGYSLPKEVTPWLQASVNFRPPDVTYANAAHVVEVEVDIGTGGVKILRYVVANDSGRLINPTIAEGQLHGGTAHGIGNALFEWMGYDENAQPVTTTLADYLLPTATEVPNFEIIHAEIPSTLNPLGVKGIGEAGTVPVAGAVISAIEHALEPFAVRIAEAPISPGRLIELIAAGRQGS